MQKRNEEWKWSKVIKIEKFRFFFLCLVHVCHIYSKLMQGYVNYTTEIILSECPMKNDHCSFYYKFYNFCHLRVSSFAFPVFFFFSFSLKFNVLSVRTWFVFSGFFASIHYSVYLLLNACFIFAASMMPLNVSKKKIVSMFPKNSVRFLT